MLKILRQESKSWQNKAIADGWIPESLHFTPAEKTKVKFTNGNYQFSSCLRCYDMPCVFFLEEEIIPDNLDGFPADMNLEVCSSGAIIFCFDTGIPIINNDNCIFCGVCANRCPVGAIHISPEIGAIVNDETNDAFINIAITDKSSYINSRNFFDKINIYGAALTENDELIERMLIKLSEASKRQGDRFPNTLARNLLIGTGIKASIPRKGNTHMRMDIILTDKNDKQGIAEVEFGQAAILDAPRDTLDSVSVLVSRYKWNFETIKAIIISDVLPNKRSEYWHIIEDISKITHIKISTVSIFSLMTLNWNRITITVETFSKFYTDRNNKSYLHEVLEKVLERPLNLKNTVRSEIDIAK